MDDDSIFIEIAGVAVGKGRPKARGVHTKDGRDFVQVYTPGKTRRWESSVRAIAQEVMGERAPLETPIAIRYVVYVAPTPSWPEWKRQAALQGIIRPTTKPDLKNIKASIEDAFNGVVFRDDSLIVEERSTVKVYDLRSRIEVTVWPLASAPAQIKRKGDLPLSIEPAAESSPTKRRAPVDYQQDLGL